MTHSQRNPQLEPSGHCYTVLQDFGPDGGGWGPAAVQILPWGTPRPFVYTGFDDEVIKNLFTLAEGLYEQTGLPTLVVRFGSMEEVVRYG